MSIRTLVLLALFLLLLACRLTAQNKFYISAAGDDINNSGNSSGDAWKTLHKLNAYMQFPGLNPGDSVFLRCGDTFSGQLNLADNGNPGTPIVFTSYGSGSKPVIAGDTTLAGASFTQTGDTFHLNTGIQVKNLYVNNTQAMIARMPNSGYYTMDAVTNNMGFTDNQLPAGNYAGATACVRTSNFTWENAPVASNTSTAITYSIGSSFTPSAGFGYYLRGKRNMLDTAYEWVYDSQLHLYVPGGQISGLTIEAGVYDYGIRGNPNRNNIHISNIHFKGQSVDAVNFTGVNCQHIEITNCTFSRQLRYGIFLQGDLLTADQNDFYDIHGKALHGDTCRNSTFSYNTFNRIGLFPGYGISGADGMAGISLFRSDYCTIAYNVIDSVGYCGIRPDGKYNIAEKNILDHCMMRLSDAGSVYLYGPASQYVTVRKNFITASDGYPQATPATDFKTPAIYFDFWVNHCTADSNVISQQAHNGMQLNPGAQDNVFTNNIVYGAGDQGMIIIDNTNDIQANPVPVINNRITHNVFYCLDNDARCLGQASSYQSWNTGVIDSNYYCQPYNDTVCTRLNQQSFQTNGYTLNSWQGLGFDAQTIPSFYQWTFPANYSQLFSNDSDQPVNYPLGNTEYFDLDSTVYCGSLTLPPWSARVLISSSNPCSTGDTELTAADELRIFPNPSSGLVSILAGSGVNMLQLFDISGKEIIRRNYESPANEITLDLSGYPAGMYLLKVNDHTMQRLVRM
ncbi:MAG: glycoside hydrolase family protein [Bacteroidetes bacterium]|nr:MAG: glycoside hydrolase family protein [Bacteroidota bacterium]